MLTKLESKILPVIEHEVEGKVYKLVLDMFALAKASDELKKDLTEITNWQGLTGPELLTIAWAALDLNHPEITLKDVRRWFGTADKNALFVLLIEGSWPGFLERYEKQLAELEREKKAKAAEGKPEPNPQEESLR